jgi:hypothetical protein
MKWVVGGSLLMDCYLDVVGGLVPLQCEGANQRQSERESHVVDNTEMAVDSGWQNSLYDVKEIEQVEAYSLFQCPIHLHSNLLI